MNDSDLYGRLKQVVCAQLGSCDDEVSPASRLKEDLGADELDHVELVMAVEDEFDIVILDEDAESIATVQDLLDCVSNGGKMPAKTNTSRSPFVVSFLAVQEAVYANAREKGFYDKPREDGTAIALMHSELSEALEGLRRNNPPSEHIPEFSSLEEELADVIIRAMDMGAHKGLRLAEAIEAKHAFNKGRTKMHGGKAF